MQTKRRSHSIHDYNYKPEPIFYGDSNRYFGVELEIDDGGKDSDNADELLRIGNRSSIVIVIAAPAERYAVRTGIIIAPYSTAAVLAFDGFLKIASVA